ncbi:hypothetical protein Pint_16340 [Pistacia integerrima]|uniref:Uncharacterized protein n=1 Tax=Pistacia integerrima TaxID=434235 RepID=A0ACC0ZD99_9ROSI|nr:hypothetical protein Pint_16340 [Pistacia integerrima]
MFKMNSGVDGYSGNWVCVCDTCKAAACTIYRHNDSAYLCSCCDEHIHAADSMALPHERVWILTTCENAPAAVFGNKVDAASLCVNPLPGHVSVPPVSSLACANSSTYQEELPVAMVDTAEEEIDEDDTDSQLLLEPEENDNQTNGGFTYLEELDKSVGIKDYNSCTEILYQDQKNQQTIYNAYQGDSGSDGIVPVHSSEIKEQEGHWQHQHQQQHNFYFNKEYEASKAAFINTPSSSESVRSLNYYISSYHYTTL